MTYDTNLQATEQEPIPELYHFYSGPDSEYVTSYNAPLTFQGEQYLDRPIQRSGWNLDENFSPISVSITAPLTQTFTNMISNNPVEPAHVKVYKSIVDDLTDFALVFKGVMKGIQISNLSARGQFETRVSQLKGRLPKIRYQSHCNWDVFDDDCDLSPSSFRVDTQVTVAGSTLVSSAFSSFSNGHFTAGRVAYGANERWITNHVGDTITLQIPFDNRLVTGETVAVYPGCDGSPSSCKNKFNNWDKSLMMPYIPSHNPVVYGV